MENLSAVEYGFITGRFIFAVADSTIDPDRLPDAYPAPGDVTLTPVAASRVVVGASPVTVLPRPIKLTTDENGYLVDPTGTPGVWVVAGQYDVRCNFTGVQYPGFRIAVTAAHTALAPLDLTLAAPLSPSPDIKFVVNEAIYTETLAARDAAIAAAKTATVPTAQVVDSAVAEAVAPIDERVDGVETALVDVNALAAGAVPNTADGRATFLAAPDVDSALASKISVTGDARYSGLRDHEVSAREFGVRGDGTDETSKMQAFLDYIVANGAHGVIPFREVRVSQPLNIAAGRGWTLRGMGRWRGTNITQTGTNVPILRVGVGGGINLRDWVISDLCLTYATPQPATAAAANCVLFEAMPYQFELHNVYFRNGFYAIAYQAGVGGAWGGDWDGIIFGAMSGGWINMAGTVNSVPNNRFGRIYGDSSTCTDYLFKSFTGYNTTMASVEVINHANGDGVVGSGVFDFTTGSSFIIGAFKIEGGRFTAPNVDIVRVPAGCFIQFGEFRIQASNGGLTVAPSAGDCSVFALNSGGTSVATVDVGLLAVTASAEGFSKGYLFRGGQRFSQVFVRRLEKSQWKLSNRPGGALVNENIRIDQWMNRRLSANKGDAGLTIVPGETEHSLFFETPLTAQRDVVPPTDSSELIGGLAYRIHVAANVVNGTNYLRIAIPGVRVVYSKTTPAAEVITIEWRTNASGAAGWVVTGVNPA